MSIISIGSDPLLEPPDFQDAPESLPLGIALLTLLMLGLPEESIDISAPAKHSSEQMIATYRLICQYVSHALEVSRKAI